MNSTARSVAGASRIERRAVSEPQHAASTRASDRELVELALYGLPDPMHPEIPRQFVDGLVAAQIVLCDVAHVDDPGDVQGAIETLRRLEARYV